ncbi:MAG: L-2-amino-thiazoline-4-carboxylic acid hydrolase [Eubacteriales bacterium]|nr:L-2-amino-thiazoline-4-carboxylic acid hydrolase [Eubacteriales bacterium]
MKTAETIMESKGVIKAEMDKVLPKAESDALWKDATEKLGGLLLQYRSLPKGVHMHTDSRILPSAAIYLTVKDVTGQEQAYRIIEDAVVQLCAGIAERLRKLVKLPGMKDLFISIWDPMTKKMFGSGNGFKNVFYTKKKGEYRMDVTECPYCRYFTELGCPELTKIFCENDERIYGNLPGLRFERTGTLGKGAQRCDFYLRKV